MSINQLVENLLGFGNKLKSDPGLKQGSAFQFNAETNHRPNVAPLFH